MGNNQSNENKDLKIFKIERREIGVNYIQLHLNSNVDYRNGNYKFIYVANCPYWKWLFAGEKYIEIDLNKTRNYDSGHTFTTESSNAVNYEFGEVREVRDSNGFTEFLKVINEYLGERAQRQEQHALMESNMRASNWANLYQTSHNLN